MFQPLNRNHLNNITSNFLLLLINIPKRIHAKNLPAPNHKKLHPNSMVFNDSRSTNLPQYFKNNHKLFPGLLYHPKLLLQIPRLAQIY